MEWRRLRSVLLRLSRFNLFFLPPRLQSSAGERCSWRRLGVNNQGYGAGKPVTLVSPNVLCRRLLRLDLSCGSSLHFVPGLADVKM